MSTETYIHGKRLPPLEKIKRYRFFVTPFKRVKIPTVPVVARKIATAGAPTPFEITYETKIAEVKPIGVTVIPPVPEIPKTIVLRPEEEVVYTSGINISTAGDHIIVAKSADKHVRIVNILLIARGEVLVTFKSGELSISGPMSLGAVDQPRGFFCHLGFWPIQCGLNKDFVIHLSAAIGVQGFCTYYCA